MLLHKVVQGPGPIRVQDYSGENAMNIETIRTSTHMIGKFIEWMSRVTLDVLTLNFAHA